MPHFIPTDSAKAEALNARLSSTVFKNYDHFVELYNSDLIAKKKPEVIQLVEEIENSFKNISHEGGKLIFISENEILLDEIFENLTPWITLVKIKREINNLVESNEVDLDIEDNIVFRDQGIGFIHIVTQDEDGADALLKVGTEKHVSKNTELEEIFQNYSSYRNEERSDGLYFFKVEDFLLLDDGFIKEIHSLLAK